MGYDHADETEAAQQGGETGERGGMKVFAPVRLHRRGDVTEKYYTGQAIVYLPGAEAPVLLEPDEAERMSEELSDMLQLMPPALVSAGSTRCHQSGDLSSIGNRTVVAFTTSGKTHTAALSYEEVRWLLHALNACSTVENKMVEPLNTEYLALHGVE